MRPLINRIFAMLIVGLSLGLTFGCGERGTSRLPIGKVSGKVVYNGKPVPGVAVTFTMENTPRASTGLTDDKGEFQLTTYNTDDGAFVGTNKVTVIQSLLATTGKQYTAKELADKGPPPPPKGGVIPDKYADPKTTPLKNTVDKGQNNFTIELKD